LDHRRIGIDFELTLERLLSGCELRHRRRLSDDSTRLQTPVFVVFGVDAPTKQRIEALVRGNDRESKNDLRGVLFARILRGVATPCGLSNDRFSVVRSVHFEFPRGQSAAAATKR